MAASVSDLPKSGKRSNAAPPLEPLACGTDDVCIWRVHLDRDDATVAACAALLSGDELQRAERLRSAIDRNRYFVARGSLRQLLADWLDTRPSAIEFEYGPRGKPFLRGATPPQFNLSHAGGTALIAISSRRPVGVDIESLNRNLDFAALAGRFFSAGERAALSALPADRRKHAFLTGWTRKESILKATGDGLSLPLDQFEVSLDVDAPARVLSTTLDRIAKCALHELRIDGGFVASLATYDHDPG